MNFLLSIFLSLLPKRYRKIFTSHAIPSGGAVASGFLETFMSIGLLIHGYFLYSDKRLAVLPVSVMKMAGEKGGESAIMGMGTIFMLEYLIHFSTLLVIFFIFEGVVRGIAAIASGDILPSLPLQVLAFMHTKLQAQTHERILGRRVCDQVYACGEYLQIASCRPKPWTQLTSICYEGVFYELIDEKQDRAPHRFVYILREKPGTAVIRGIYSYDPNEVLQSKS
jgi:hypothetical protein